jgi:flagellin FlaB
MKKMKKLSRILKENDLGDMGIGAMIIFIAVVLVAGIAASVLIQTANRLEIQAMQTGQETIREVSSGLQIIDIEGANEGGVITQMVLVVRPHAGSGDIDLSNAFVEISDGVTKTILIYDGNFTHIIDDSEPDVFNATNCWNESSATFGILVLQDADESLTDTNPVINRGDVVMLCINTSLIFTTNSGLTPRSTITGLVTPEQGASATFSFRVPSSLSEVVYDLY